MKRKLRMGMVGGGKDAFIGAIHRIAANADGLIELVCGALSINKDIAIDSGHSLFLPENRIYLTYEEMIEKEKQLPEGERMDFLTIVTPIAPALPERLGSVRQAAWAFPSLSESLLSQPWW